MSNTESGREPVILVEIDQDICINVFGVPPCTAALSDIFPNKCFNTRATCADPDNYDLSLVPLTLRFCRAMEVIPREWEAIPCLVSVDTTPTRMNPGGASRNSGPLGVRASVTIRMRDFPSSDFQVDPYHFERHSGAAQFNGVGYNPLDRGSFWSKWIKRNPYHINNAIRIREGYIEQDPSEMTTRNYIIKQVTEPDAAGSVMIKAVDMFALADDDTAQAPAVTQGYLENDIDAVVNQVDLVGWIAGEYPAGGGTVRIGSEVLTYAAANPAGDTLQLTGCVRGTDGTAAATHSQGDLVQLCYRVDNVLCWEVVRDLLVDFAAVDSGFIPFADWQAEGTTWLPTFTVTTLITEPTGVNQLLGELCEQCLFDLWWDEREQEIKFQALRAFVDVPVQLNDRQHIIAGSWSTQTDMNQRVSEVWFYYGQRDPTKSLNDKTNFAFIRIRTDPALSGPEQYKTRQTKQIFSRWIESEIEAFQVTIRYLQRFQDGSRFLKIRVDAKDRDIWTGTIVSITMHSMVDSVGLPETRRWQVISAEEVIPGEVVEYNLQNYIFAAEREAFWVGVLDCRSAADQWTLSAGGTDEYYFDNSGPLMLGLPAGVYFYDPPNDWWSGIDYLIDDCVIEDGNIYAAIINHSSSGLTRPPEATHWRLIMPVPLPQQLNYDSRVQGVAGALDVGEWAWGDNDGLGYNTIYVRLMTRADPDTLPLGAVLADYPLYPNMPTPDVIIGLSWYADDDGLMPDGREGYCYQGG